MRVFALLVVVLGLAGLGTAADFNVALDGKWIVESVVRDGTADESLSGATREHKGEKYSVTPKEGSKAPAVSGTCKLSSTKAFSLMDMKPTTGRYKDKTLLGIYKIEGEKLTICFAEPDKDRPTAFESKPGSGWVLATHTKAK